MANKCATNISNTCRAKAHQKLAGKNMEIYSPLNKEVSSDVIGKFNGITSQKLYDVQEYLNSLDNAITRNTSIEDWVENDLLIFPHKKYAEAFANTDSNYIIEGQSKASIINESILNRNLSEQEKTISNVLKILNDNGLAKSTQILSDKEYKKKQKELTGTNVNSNGFVHERTIYYNEEKITPETPIHENAHIWYSLMESLNPELIRRANELIVNTEYYINAKERYKNVYKSEQDIIEEAVVTMLGENLLERYEAGEVATEHQSIWEEIWQNILDFINAWFHKEYQLKDIQKIAYKDIFGGRDIVKEEAIEMNNSKFAITPQDVKENLQQNLLESLTPSVVRNLIAAIKTTTPTPEIFADYESKILNFLLYKRRQIEQVSKDIMPDKEEILNKINQQIKIHHDNLMKIFKGEAGWNVIIKEEIDALVKLYENLDTKDVDYGFMLVQISDMYDIFITHYSKILEKELDADLKNKLSLMENDLRKKMSDVVKEQIIKERTDRKGDALNEEELGELGNSVTAMFSTENDVSLLCHALGIKQAMKSTNEELGEYILNEFISNKNVFLGETSAIISELRELEKRLSDNTKLKDLFISWEVDGIKHREQILISPYEPEVLSSLKELADLKSKILNGINIEENVKLYHQIVQKYFDISLTIDNIKSHKETIIKRLGKDEYEKLEKRVEENAENFFENDFLMDMELGAYSFKETVHQNIKKGSEIDSLFLFEILIPKEEYTSKQFKEKVLSDNELYQIWIRLDHLLTSFHNPTIHIYDKNYGKSNNFRGLEHRRIPILAKVNETQIKEFNKAAAFFVKLGMFFHRLYGSVISQKEKQKIAKHIASNKQSGAFKDTYLRQYNDLFLKYNQYSYEDLKEEAIKLDVVKENIEINSDNFAYVIDGVIKSKIASKSRYNIIEIVEALNLSLADVYAGNSIKHRIDFIINNFRGNKHKYSILKGWYNRTILGESGVANWQTKKIKTFHSKSYKKWLDETLKEIEENGTENLNLAEYDISYNLFTLEKTNEHYYISYIEDNKVYYKGTAVIDKSEYDKAFKEMLKSNSIDEDATYITVSSIMNMFLVIKVIRDLGLSLNAALTNRRAGRLANEQTAMSERWYSYKELLGARNFLYGSIPSQMLGVMTGDMGRFLLMKSSDKRKQVRMFEQFIKYNNLIMQKDLFEYEDGRRMNHFLMGWAIDVPEFSNQGEVLLAMLSRLEYDKRDENGEIVRGKDGKPKKVKFFNLKTGEFELFDSKSGDLRLKKEYQSLEKEIMHRQGGAFNKMLIEYRYVNQMNQGNYSKDDAPNLYSQPLGKVLLTYTRWIPETIFRLYKGLYSPKDIAGRLNVLTGEKERIGVLTQIARYPALNVIYNVLAGVVSTGPIAAIGMFVGFPPMAIIGIAMIGSFLQGVYTSHVVKNNWVYKGIDLIEQGRHEIKNELKRTLSTMGNTLIRVLASSIPGNNPIANKMKVAINSGADIKLGWEELIEDPSYHNAKSLYADMQQMNEASQVLASEIRKFLFITLMSVAGPALIGMLLGAIGGGDDDDDEALDKLSKVDVRGEKVKDVKMVQFLLDNRIAIAEGLCNKIMNMSIQGYDANQFAFSPTQLLGYFSPNENPNTRSISMIYSNLASTIKMLNGLSDVTNSRVEKALVYGNFFVPMPSKITHAIVDISILMEKNGLRLEDKTIELIKNKRTVFTDTQVYTDGQATMLEIFNPVKQNKIYKSKFEVLYKKATDDLLEHFMKTVSEEKNIEFDLTQKKLFEEDLKNRMSKKRSGYLHLYRTIDLPEGVNYKALYLENVDDIKYHLKTKRYKFFLGQNSEDSVDAIMEVNED